MNRIILIADNDPDFLDTRTEYLEAKGYKVYKALSIEQAERLLESVWIHVAIIDVRLHNDADPNDVSGLWLAKNANYRAVPKIILTRWPTYQAVREALGPSLEGLPPAIDFVAKQEGPKAMLGSIEKVFQSHVQQNVQLSVQYGENGPRTFLHLVSLIETDLRDDVILHRAEELEDLFRRLFQREKRIRIDRLIWQNEERLALAIFADSDGKNPESIIVVCGKRTSIIEEASHYRDFAPPAPSRSATVLTKSSETLHYGANAYALSGAQVENLQSLRSLYDSGPEKSFNAALNTLFETVLADWHQEKRIVEESVSLDDIYCRQLGLSLSLRSESEKRIQSIIRQSLTLGENLELHNGYLKIHFPGQTYSYKDPTTFLDISSKKMYPTETLMITPGKLSGKNILTDETGSVWITDFAQAGPAPSLWNYISLEAAIRFDWVKTNRLQWLHEMERCLTSSEFTKLYVGDVEPPLRKPLRAIQNVRRQASRYVGNNYLNYHLGVFFQAAHRLVSSSFSSPVRSSLEIGQLTHILLASAMICDLITSSVSSPPTEAAQGPKNIRIDKFTREVWVNGVRVSLRGQNYDLLCYLYDHLNKLRTRREIIEEVFGEKYDESDISQISRLNTAIHRLRERIEDDPYNPRFLLTEPTLGYKLIIEPSSK